MKFGRKLEAASVLLPAHGDSMLKYKQIKKMLKSRHELPARSTFTMVLQKEIDRLNDHVAAHLLGIQHAAALMLPGDDGWAPYAELARLSSAAGHAIAFIQVCRIGLRKIAKKFDKRRTHILKTMGGIDTSPSRQDVVLRWLELAPFCTAHLEQLHELQQHLLLACPENKRHLLEHLQRTAAACQHEITEEKTAVCPRGSSPTGTSSSPFLADVPCAALLPLPCRPPATEATQPEGDGAMASPTPVHARLARMLLSPASKLARQRHFSGERGPPDSCLHRRPHEPANRSMLGRTGDTDSEDERHTTGETFGYQLPPTLQTSQPLMLGRAINGLFS